MKFHHIGIIVKNLNQSVPKKRGSQQRKKDFNEIYADYVMDLAKSQSSRCSQCGVPFCQIHCPLGNNIPDFMAKYAAEEGQDEERCLIGHSKTGGGGDRT